MILVTGATGNVGREVVRQLVERGQRVRALAQDPDAAKRALPPSVEIARGDFTDPTSLDQALRGVERVYLLAPMVAELAAYEANLIDAATRAKVAHVVKHSVLGAPYEAIALGRWHRAGEKRLESSGLAWTVIRPSGFFTNALGWAGMIRGGGKVYHPTGGGTLAVIDPRDIAAVAVEALVGRGHEGKSYDLTGPEALTTRQQVDIIAKAIGAPVEAVDVPDAAARESMLGQGMPPAIADALLEFTGMVRAGQTSLVTPAVRELTKREPRTFAAWVGEHVAAFR